MKFAKEADVQPICLLNRGNFKGIICNRGSYLFRNRGRKLIMNKITDVKDWHETSGVLVKLSILISQAPIHTKSNEEGWIVIIQLLPVFLL